MPGIEPMKTGMSTDQSKSMTFSFGSAHNGISMWLKTIFPIRIDSLGFTLAGRLPSGSQFGTLGQWEFEMIRIPFS